MSNELLKVDKINKYVTKILIEVKAVFMWYVFFCIFQIFTANNVL